jgi:hypothetical protein
MWRQTISTLLFWDRHSSVCGFHASLRHTQGEMEAQFVPFHTPPLLQLLHV